ncbi:MAG: S-methyl-5-thioribose-1-phosphate isomerase [Candidatus Bathyarchaeia archaeon]
MRIIKDAAMRIRSLEVQGATNVALTAVKALVEQMKVSEANDMESALAEIEQAKDILFQTRETEPFMRNAVRFIERELRKRGWRTIGEFQGRAQELADELFEDFYMSRQRTAEVGSKRIRPGYTVLTHCRSSAVTMVFKEAARQGTQFEVILTETRPIYQGRITARELLDEGVKVTMIVDSAVRAFIKSADLVLVGADAITSEGNVINKIGTSQVALSAHEARIPFYVVTELLKFDPQTIHGDYEAIEERDASEIWEDAPEELNIRNPAFDVTRRDYIHGIICEEGIISPHSIVEAVRKRYPWVLETAGPSPS